MTFQKPARLLVAVLCVLAVLTACACGLSYPDGAARTQSAQTPSAGTQSAGAADPARDEESSPDTSGAAEQPRTEPVSSESGADALLPEDGVYDSKDDVALYLHTYGHLPYNYISKSEARALGWSGGSVEDYRENAVIGGDRFGNYEKRLPAGRSYRECDIGTLGARGRGAERLIYTDDGWIYYTRDHYETFELLYEGE